MADVDQELHDQIEALGSGEGNFTAELKLLLHALVDGTEKRAAKAKAKAAKADADAKEAAA
jgi:hypothetical protein